MEEAVEKDSNGSTRPRQDVQDFRGCELDEMFKGIHLQAAK